MTHTLPTQSDDGELERPLSFWDRLSAQEQAELGEFIAGTIEEATANLHLWATKQRIEGMKQAQSRVLRRTEIPEDAKNPVRDSVVRLGEQIIADLEAEMKGEK